MWQTVVKTALIGTERGQFSESEKEKLQQFGVQTTGDAAAVVLEAAALLGQAQRVGRALPRLAGGLPKPAPSETRTVCAPETSRKLNLLLHNEDFAPALPEFLNYLAKTEQVLSPESLPQLLEVCGSNRQLWEAVKSVIGERGRWLAAAHPIWYQLLAETKREDWTIGTREERLAILRQLRAEDPQKARALVTETWAEDGYRERQAFLQCFQNNLSEEDLPLLEIALDDSRSEVRKAAALLSFRLPNSALVRGLFECAQPFLTLKSSFFGKKSLNITLPEHFDPYWKRADISEKSNRYPVGNKANWLGEVLSRIPPSLWDAHFGTKPEQTLTLFLEAEWQHILLQSLIDAVGVTRDKVWAELLFKQFFLEKWGHKFKELRFEPLMWEVSKPLFNQVALKCLKDKRGYHDNTHDISNLLVGFGDDYIWEDDLARAFYDNLVQWLDKETQHWRGWHYRTILKKMVFRCNPNLRHEFLQKLPTHAPTWSYWQKDFELFLNILKFRVY